MTQDYTTLMLRRIRRILLICSNYDSFALEEDGRLDAQIALEYAELNLSNPPDIERVESTVEALALLAGGARFDLVITMYNVGEVDVFDFSRKAKEYDPAMPVVLLSAFFKGFYKKLEDKDRSCIDYIFFWNNSTDLIIAIIKLLEDKLNADHDILEAGVQAIILVEDSARYYSTYLPVLYKLVLMQNNVAVRDTLNERQRLVRKRSRPKILMATNYADAVALYERYRSNMLGIISDVGFVLHKDDKEEKIDAGVDLCKLVHGDNPKLPFLMQSSQESMRAVAEQLKVGFLLKTSKMLTHELGEYINREFCFGDFVITHPETGEEIARAKDLHELEKVLETAPEEVIRSFSENNHISKWLLARGLFSIGRVISRFSIVSCAEIENARRIIVQAIHDFRIAQGLGSVAEFNPATYNDAIRFAKLGSGSMGGKARGLAFLNHILQEYHLYDKWEGVRVVVPRTVVITTDYFDHFIIENGLQYVVNSDLSDAEILSEFVASTLPSELSDSLRIFIRNAKRPLAVRSSSKLEDSYYQPFAGVYSTYMIPRTENEDQELRLLAKAIKSVYASVYFSAARAYITATANVISEEKMAIVVQEICGSEDGGYYFPTLSGVARSVNFYPVGNENAEDGIVKLAYGLGKAVVDGEQVLRFSPKYPKHIIQTSTPEATMTETQRNMLALNLQPEKFKTSPDDAVNLDRFDVAACSRFRSFGKVVSTWDRENMRIVDSPYPEGPKYITFAHILKYNTFPLAQIMDELLEISRKEVKCNVEIEFAADLDVDEDRPAQFNVLQVRPNSVDSRDAEVDWDKVDESGAVIRSVSALGTGWIDGVSDFVYLRKESFNVLKTGEIAREVAALNARMKGCGYVLVGFGRWGTSVPSLGVPVRWADISEARVIVECSLENFRVDPSQGTHFFQNLTSFNVGYINVDPYAHRGESIDFERLDAMPAVFETEYLRHVRFPVPLRICVDGRTSRALVAG